MQDFWGFRPSSECRTISCRVTLSRTLCFQAGLLSTMLTLNELVLLTLEHLAVVIHRDLWPKLQMNVVCLTLA